MELVSIYPENARENKRMVYHLTRAESVSASKLEEGTVLAPVAWATYKDVNAKGEENTILSILCDDGTVVTTISETFRREFEFVADLMEGAEFTVVVKGGVAKSGRPYVTCEMVCD